MPVTLNPSPYRCCDADAEKQREPGRTFHVPTMCPTRLRSWSVTISTKCNYRAELMALSVGRFAPGASGNVPERHARGCGRRVPKRPTGFAKNPDFGAIR